MCVPPFALLPVKRIVSITLIPWLWGFFSWKILLAENTATIRKKGEKAHLWFDTCRGEIPAVPPILNSSLIYQGGVGVALNRNATPENVKMLQEKVPMKKIFWTPLNFSLTST